MTDKNLKILCFFVLILSMLTALGLSMYAAGSLTILDMFTVWMLSPYVILFLISHRAKSYRTLVTAAVVSVICSLGTYVYIDSLFIHLDAQGALVFFFIPLYQLIFILFGFSISAIIGFLRRKNQLPI